MTYNFDPERWYQNEREALESAYRGGSLTTRALQLALDELDERFEAMLNRLDGTYQLPPCGEADVQN
jgi:hypothetical protein